VDEFLNVKDRAGPMIAALGVFACAASGVFEALVSWESVPGGDSLGEADFANDCAGKSVFACRQWQPGIAGGILGSLQLVLMYSTQSCMGSSTAYQSIVAAPFLLFGQDRRDKLAGGKSRFK
jgi:hypothetical protein